MGNERWTPAEIEYIEAHPGTPIAAIAKALGRSYTAVQTKRRQMRPISRTCKAPEPAGKAHAHTLCWDCRRAAGPAMCSWALWGEPVPGWTATPTVLRATESETESYLVTDCPMFRADRKERRIG